MQNLQNSKNYDVAFRQFSKNYDFVKHFLIAL